MGSIKYTTLCTQITHIFRVQLEIYGRQNRHCSGFVRIDNTRQEGKP